MEGGGGDPQPSVSLQARTPSEGGAAVDLDLLEQLLSGDNGWFEVVSRSPNSLASPPPAAFFSADVTATAAATTPPGSSRPTPTWRASSPPPDSFLPNQSNSATRDQSQNSSAAPRFLQGSSIQAHTTHTHQPARKWKLRRSSGPARTCSKRPGEQREWWRWWRRSRARAPPPLSWAGHRTAALKGSEGESESEQ